MKVLDNYTKTLHIKAPVGKVYEAISTQNGVQMWWTADCEMDTLVGGGATFSFDHSTYVTVKIAVMTENQHVLWRCIDQQFKIKGTDRTDEWVGTKIRFHLEGNNDGTTTLSFTHEGLTPNLDCYKESVEGWNYFLGSLKKYLEEGKGTPYEPKK